MHILAVEDKKLPLEALTDAIRKAEPDAEIHPFRNGEDTLAFARTQHCEVAFIDIRLPVMNGVELARRLKELQPAINIIFATGYGEYAGEAWELHGSGYLMKPITPEKVRKELDDLRFPVAAVRGKTRLQVQTFGRFEVYLDGKPVSFRHRKTKEYLAFLIDKAALCTNGEIAAALWEKTMDDSYIRILRKDLTDTLQAAGIEDILYRERNEQGIRKEAIDCDFFDWKKGLPAGKRAYHGEYMSQYSWAEETHAMLEFASGRSSE